MTDQRMTHGYRGESAPSRWHRSARGRTGEVTSEGYRRSRETYELRHPGTASPVEFGTHPGQESYLTFLNGMPLLGYLPFGRSLWEAQWGELVIVTPNDNYEIRAYDRATGALARQGYQNMPLVEQFPAFRMLLTDPLNHLWVREATLPGMDRPAPLWTVFDPEGRALGFIETPAGLPVFEIGADYLLGRATDDLGVKQVQVWALERVGG